MIRFRTKTSAALITALIALCCAIGRADPSTQAVKTDKVTYLGVTAKPVDDTLRAQLDLPDGVGLTVITVDRKGPAGKDVKPNDVLQKLDDQMLIDAHQLVTLIRLHKPGDTVTLTLIRGAKPITVTIKLGEKERAAQPAAPNANDPDHQQDLPGVKTPDQLSGRIPFDQQLPLGGNAQVALSFKDDVYSAFINTDKDGHKKLVVKNAVDKVVTEAIVDTPEQWAALPPDICTHLEVLRKMMVDPK